MFSEIDSFEIVLTDQNYIYKIDNTASFAISNYLIDMLGINIEFKGANIKSKISKQILEQLKHERNDRNTFNFDYDYNEISEKYGKEYTKYYLHPLHAIQEVKQDYIDDFLNTLCYIYPDFLGEYYRQYIDIVRIRAWEYLKTKNK